MMDRKYGELFALANEVWIGGNHEPTCSQLDGVCEDCIKVPFVARVQDMEFQPKGVGCRSVALV